NTEPNKKEPALKDAAVKLMRLDGTDWTMVTAAKLDLLEHGKEARLVFVPEKPPLWTGPPAKLQLWLETKNKETFKQDLPVFFRHPERYLRIDEARYDHQMRRISFSVSLQEPFNGPKCTVRLVL